MSNESEELKDSGIHHSHKVAAGEDKLFEVDLVKREYYPIYWLGPLFEIRRGTWFQLTSNQGFQPCDDNLTRQLEDGYK